LFLRERKGDASFDFESHPRRTRHKERSGYDRSVHLRMRLVCKPVNAELAGSQAAPPRNSSARVGRPERQTGRVQQKTEPLVVPGRRARKDIVVTKLVDKTAGYRLYRCGVGAEPVAQDGVQSSRGGVPVGPAGGRTNTMGFLGSVLEYPGHFDGEPVSTERRGLKVQECAQDQSSFVGQPRCRR
jgi:hypothetical protein